MVFLSEDPDEKYPDQAEQPAPQTELSTDKKLLENVDQPSEEVTQPAGEKEPIDQSVGKVEKPAENSDQPSVNGDLNLTKVDQLSEEFDRPPVKSEDREKPVLHNGTVAEEQCDTAEAETLSGGKDESKDKAPENVIRTEENSKSEDKASAETAVGETVSGASQDECTDGSQGSQPAVVGKGEDAEAMQVDSGSLVEAANETTDSSNGEAEAEKSTAAEATKPSGPIMRIVNETEAYEDSDKEDNDKEENEEDAMEIEEQEEEEEKKSGVEAVQNGDGEERKEEGETSEDSKTKEGQDEGEKLKLVEVNGDSSKLLEADKKDGEKEENETKKEVKKVDSLENEEDKKAEKENEKEEEVKEKVESEKKEGETKKAETEKEEEAKKPTLKLASFADITEEMDKNQESSPT